MALRRKWVIVRTFETEVQIDVKFLCNIPDTNLVYWGDLYSLSVATIDNVKDAMELAAKYQAKVMMIFD